MLKENCMYIKARSEKDTAELVNAVMELHEQGLSMRAIADQVESSKSTVQRIIKNHTK